ncbi:phospholipid carrier-dependent glycosyltransferase [Spirillospora sp. NPDC029432]|uniref:phospholipid carrier-dependent glycosyltransferase n=1 Tax=Spirillospora sp. NPDC029432 TaxID=3154599 RepID=UPI0034566FEF
MTRAAERSATESGGAEESAGRDGDTPKAARSGKEWPARAARRVRTAARARAAATAGRAAATRESAVRAGREFAADPGGKVREGSARFWALNRRHPFFAVILATAALLRAVSMLAYQPAMYFNDTFDYLHVAMKPYPHPLRPDGYSFLLILLKPFHSFALVVAVQHLMGLAMGVMVYALLRKKFGLPGWGAALATTPFLLDAYQIQLEHLILSDVQFMFLVVCAVTVLLWHDRPTWKIAAALGLIIGMAWLTRSVGLPVLIGVLVYMLIRRTGWRMMAVTLAACALPVVAYAGWYKAEQGKFAITESNGIFLYARVYKFADCHEMDSLPTEEIPLCTEPETRLPLSQAGIWDAASPLNRYTGKRFGPDQNKVANSYAKRAILSQPVDYLKVVGYDFLRVFRWDRTVFPDKATYQQYEFGEKSSALPNWRMDQDNTAADEAVAYEQGRARTRVVEPFAGFMRVYQDYFYLRGTGVGVILLIGLAGMGVMWRRLGGSAFLPWSLGTGLLLAPAATAEFDYRYVLPAVPLACLAAGMAFSPEARGRFTVLLRRRSPAVAAAPEPPAEQVEEKIPEPAAN